MQAPAVPDRVGPYVVEATLGRGAMGIVYLALDTRLGRRVALKMIHVRAGSSGTSPASADYLRRLQREAEVCAALHHPNIVTLFDVGYESDRISYLAMEYVAGESLSDAIRRQGSNPMPAEAAVRIASDVLKGLAFAHGKGIVHRDIKPANVLIAHDQTAKIADFGIARPTQSDMTIAGSVMGTPNYMSPEQANGLSASPLSDLFSVGVMMYEMLTGSKPFAGTDTPSTLQHIIEMPTPSVRALNPSLSVEYDTVIQRLTAKVPEERYGSALDALHAVRSLLEPPSVAHPAEKGGGLRIAQVLRRAIRPPVFWSIVAATAAVAFVPVIIIRSTRTEQPLSAIAPETIDEFARKNAALREADQLYRAGKYEESLTRYEAYLARYPYSTVAIDGAERSKAALAHKSESARQPARRQRSAVDQLKRKLKRIFH